jgi:hypothetical protein
MNRVVLSPGGERIQSKMKKVTSIQEFLDDPEVVNFIGNEYVRYRERWLRAFHKTQDIEKIHKVPALNILCFLLPPVWLGYRKQCKLFAALLGLMAILTTFEIFAGFLIPIPVYLIIFAVVSLYVSGSYFTYTRNFFENLETDDPARREYLIKKHGGTSLAGAAAGGLSFLVILLIVYEIGMWLAYSLGLDTSHIAG